MQERRPGRLGIGARLLLVLSGSVRHGDWAGAGERFGGGGGQCGAAGPRREQLAAPRAARRAFGSWKEHSIGLVASPGSGSGATPEGPPPNRSLAHASEASHARHIAMPDGAATSRREGQTGPRWAPLSRTT